MLKHGEKPYFQVTRPDGTKARLGGPNWDIASTKGDCKKYADNHDKIDWSDGGKTTNKAGESESKSS